MYGQMWGAIAKGAGAASEGIAGLIGYLLSQGDREAANRLYEEQVANLNEIDIPAFDELIAQEAVKQKDISPDSSVREAQLGALNKMKMLSDQGGLDPQAQAMLQEARASSQQLAHGQNQAVLSNAARRGMLSSGDALAGQLAGSQAAAVGANQAGLDIASQARQRALMALQGVGSMSGAIRGQDFAVDNANREAEARRQEFNAGMRQAAQSGNIAQRQALANLKMKKVAMLNQGKQNLADRYDSNSARTQKVASGVGRGLNEMSSAAGDMLEDMPF